MHAELEYNHGNPEVARTLFERLISEKPKRLDIFLAYLRLEARSGDPEATRDLFERALSIKLTGPMQQKVEKLYLNFESTRGGQYKSLKRRLANLDGVN